MFGPKFKLFRLFGFQISADVSWLFLALLITWTLAGWFGERLPGLSVEARWLMGAAGAAGLFVSIILHECAHALVARRFGISMRGITLFIFGGVAEMDDEPPSARSEFWVAIAGPVASLALAGLFSLVAAAAFLGEPVAAVFAYLGVINLVLVVFNMIPAFPLDGGRVLRAALWAWKGNLMRATKVASSIGSAFAFLLMAVGVLTIISGNLIGGIWSAVIAMFIRGASQMSYQQVVLRRALQGEPVRRFMNPEPVAVPPQISVRDFIDHYLYKHHRKMFPVVRSGELLGHITFASVKTIPADEWATTPVQSLVQPPSPDSTIGPDADALDALSKMRRGRVSRLLVVGPTGELTGVIALKDLLEFLALKIELEGDDD